jgi:hypothetical protein
MKIENCKGLMIQNNKREREKLEVIQKYRELGKVPVYSCTLIFLP